MQNHTSQGQYTYGAVPLFLGMMGVGVLGLVVFGLQAVSFALFASAVGTGLLVAGASFFMGGLVGFLFGIPRSLQRGNGSGDGAQATEQTQASYQANTNLEQISDWLTKILVGAGLTQLANVPELLGNLGDYLAPGLGNFASSKVVGVGLALDFTICGFFLSYLWTRLNLARLFVQADELVRTARAEGRREGEKEFLDTVAQASTVKAAQNLRGLWVDDKPSNNVREQQLAQRVLGIEFLNSPSTEDALAKLQQDPKSFSVIISDMGRPGDPQAGYTLLEKVRSMGLQTPFIVYTRSSSPKQEEEAKQRGAQGHTHSPQQLLQLLTEILQRR